MLTLLGCVTLAAAVGLGVYLVGGLARIPELPEPGPLDGAPEVSIVVAAKDEVRSIRDAIPSLLAQDYPVEVIVVDDRSTDGTGAVLDALADTEPRLRVEHIRDLPNGWLGKNHALQRGAALATGGLLLFTDADVMMRPDAVRRAVQLMETLDVDHLAVTPRLEAGSAWSSMALAVFLGIFALFYRPWRAQDPDSRSYIGIGAFNLVRAEAYRGIGGHEAVALRPDDDVRLGRALKRAGARQAAASGHESIRVLWYESLGAMARGLRKNAFAVVDYRVSAVVAMTLLPLLLVFWPVAALVVTDGLTWWLNAGTLAAGMVTTTVVSRPPGLPVWVGLASPIGSVLLLWIVWSAAYRALRTGAIEWRGTYYPLDELR